MLRNTSINQPTFQDAHRDLLSKHRYGRLEDLTACIPGVSEAGIISLPTPKVSCFASKMQIAKQSMSSQGPPKV